MTTKTIGTGGDYSTIASWFAACPADLVSTTQTWRGELKNETFTLTSGVSFTGITTNSTYYVELTTEAGASFADNANVQTNALRYNASNGAAITCSTAWVPMLSVATSMHFRMSMVQIRSSHNNTSTFTQNAVSGNTTVNRCIVETQHSSNGAVVLYGSGSTVSNSLLINRRSSSVGPALGVGNGAGAYNCTLACTVAAGAVAITGNYGTPVVKNCAVFGFTAIKSGGNTPTYTTCATDIASPPTGFTGSLTGSSQFESLTDGSHDFRLKSGSSLIGAGTTESTYAATDIAGTSRPSGTGYDIGAWEFVTATGYTLTCAQGSYTLSGQAAGTKAARTLAMGQGTYTLTGSAASLLEGHVINCALGSYTLTGSTAYADYAITCASGSYTLSGQAAALGAARLLALAQGSYTLTGQDVALLYTTPGAYSLAMGQGSYALTGQAAALQAARRTVAAQGLYALSGQAAALRLGRQVALAAGSYNLTGQDIAFDAPARLVAAAGSYALTGQAVTLTYAGAPVAAVLSAPPSGRRLQGYGRPANIQRSTR